MAQYQIPASHLVSLKKDELIDHIKLLYSYIGTLEKENEEPKIWKSIARRKTEALTHCFPSYNPTFQTCDDKEEIIRMIEELKRAGAEAWDSELFWDVSESLKEHIDDYGTHKEGEIICAIEKLKEENDELNEQLDLFSKYFKFETYDELDIYINKLKNNNQKLNELLFMKNNVSEKLKKENEKLKSMSRN